MPKTKNGGFLLDDSSISTPKYTTNGINAGKSTNKGTAKKSTSPKAKKPAAGKKK